MSRTDAAVTARARSAGLAALLLAVAAHARAASPVVVSQANRAFAVNEVQIKPGETIRFNNDDVFAHQIFINAPGLSYESDEQEPGQAVNVTFPKAGSYLVQCHIHPKMRMRVDVR